MGSTRPDRIPLFPLNVVLLPGGDLPLHIFEPRYRRMVKECIETKSEFGMLLALPKGFGGGRIVLRDRGHASDGFDVEAASAGIAVGGGSPRAAGHVPERVGAASTKD